jgi:hypothetical protein
VAAEAAAGVFAETLPRDQDRRGQRATPSETKS